MDVTCSPIGSLVDTNGYKSSYSDMRYGPHARTAEVMELALCCASTLRVPA